jgi:hypothetical protein
LNHLLDAELQKVEILVANEQEQSQLYLDGRNIIEQINFNEIHQGESELNK